DWVAVLREESLDFRVKGGDALVEVFDVTGEVADAAAGDLFDEAVAEADPLQPAQLPLAGEVDNARFAHWVNLIPVGPEPLNCLSAVADKPAPLELEQRERADELWLERRSELGTLGQDDLGDRDRITRVGLARSVPAPLAVGAPGGHFEPLVPCRLERGDEQTAVARGRFDANDRV